MKLIRELSLRDKAAKIYRDEEWKEYRVRFYRDGEHYTDADYHTDSIDDAVSTAKHFLYN